MEATAFQPCHCFHSSSLNLKLSGSNRGLLTCRSVTNSLEEEKVESWAADPTLTLATAALEPLHSPMTPCSL